MPRNFFATKIFWHKFFCREFRQIVLYCIVFQKIKFLGFPHIELKLKDCIVLYYLKKNEKLKLTLKKCCFVLYCIIFKKSNRVRAKILYCIVFKPKNLPRNFFATKFLCHEIFFATNFFYQEFCRIVLYCIPKNQISRFPYHRVKIKRLYCIVFQKIKFLGFLLIELKLKDCIVLFSKKVFFATNFVQ